MEGDAPFQRSSPIQEKMGGGGRQSGDLHVISIVTFF